MSFCFSVFYNSESSSEETSDSEFESEDSSSDSEEDTGTEDEESSSGTEIEEPPVETKPEKIDKKKETPSKVSGQARLVFLQTFRPGNSFLSIGLNVCFRCSNEPAH